MGAAGPESSRAWSYLCFDFAHMRSALTKREYSDWSACSAVSCWNLLASLCCPITIIERSAV